MGQRARDAGAVLSERCWEMGGGGEECVVLHTVRLLAHVAKI